MTDTVATREEFALHQLSTHDPCCSCTYLVYVYDTSTYHCYHQCKERHSRRQREMAPYDRMSEDSRPNTTRSLCAWLLFAQLCLLVSIVLCGVWFGHYKGGYDWDVNNFNYHPFFCTLGFIYIYGQGMLSFKMLQVCSSRVVKYLHATLNLSAIVFIGVGIYAAFDDNEHNLYSIHSWVGFSVVILYCLQWGCGFVVFLFPGLRMCTRTIYKQIHVFWGVVIFCGAALAIITGIMDYKPADYSSYSSEAMVANFYGTFVLISAIVVSYIVYNPDFVRQPQIDDEHIPIN